MTSRRVPDSIKDLLRAAESPSSDLSAALLGAGEIANYLKAKGLEFEINHFPSPELDRHSCFAYRATIHGPGITPTPGYSIGTSEDAACVALIEAFERYVFCEVMRRDPRPDYAACRLTTGESVRLESRFVLGDGVFYPSITSGMACHTDAAHAALSACLELCERDVLLRNWFLEIPPKKVNAPSSQSRTWIEELARPESFDLLTGLYFGLSGVSVAVSVLYSFQHRMAFIGSAAALRPESAIEKACREVLSVWIFDYLTWKQTSSSTAMDTIPEDNQIRRHHEHFDEVRSFFLDPPEERQSVGESEPSSAEILVSLFEEYDFSVAPIHVDGCFGGKGGPVLVKAYSPQAVPLFHGEFPRLLPADFDNLRAIKSYHPY